MALELMIGIAFILDLLVGDPKWFPHPVKGIGRAANYFERRTRKYLKPKLAGIITVLIMVIGTYVISLGLIKVISNWNLQLGLLVEIFLIHTSLATRSLYNESKPVLAELRQYNDGQAKFYLQKIVGRDTHNMTTKEIIRATVETVSENIIDGVIAPMFFAFFGGAPLALTYKCINTMDSMFGYKNDKYINFGWASARLDDIANWLPARIGGPVMVIAASLIGQNGKRAWSTMLKDGQNHLSPNAGIPEAVMSGALGVELGGSQHYQGRFVEKPLIGKRVREILPNDISTSHQILFITALLTLMIFVTIRLTIF
jgi:adenosylcobinamide-phosphate synthase